MAAVRADVVVIGGGPAGMAAAAAAADAGLEVVLVDGNAAVGGQYYRRRLDGTGSSRLPDRLARIATHPKVTVVANSWVWHATRAGDRVEVHLDGPQAATVSAATAVVATGSAELVLPFPGWTLPGVLTPGAAQALLKGHDLRVGGRVVVGGSGPFLLPVAAGLAAAGARVEALVEATRPRSVLGATLPALSHPARIREAVGYLRRLARAGVRPRGGRAVIRCEGVDRVETAVVAEVDAGWRPVPGTERTITADAVCVSFGFAPALDVSRNLGCRDVPHPSRPTGAVWHDADQATSVAGVFAAGEATGVGGAEIAELEGRLAGLSAARLLGTMSDRGHAHAVRPLRPALRRRRRFAALLDRLYPMRTGWLDWLDPGTTFCRCEEVPWGTVLAATTGTATARSIRAVTRCGMGYCQGRICGPPLQAVLAHDRDDVSSAAGDLQWRTIVTPTPLGVIAGVRSAADSGRRGEPA